MRPASAILLATLFAATLMPFGEEQAAASCAGPYLDNIDNLMARRGTTIEVEGAGFANGCQDTGSCSTTLGCTSCDYGPEPTPMQDISLTLQQRGHTWPLGTADATSDGLATATWTVKVPTEVKTGSATLVPEGGEPVKIRIR